MILRFVLKLKIEKVTVNIESTYYSIIKFGKAPIKILTVSYYNLKV